MEQLKKKFSRNPIKAEIYKLSDIKVALDDLLYQFLKYEMKYKQCNFVSNLRIFIGMISVIITVIIAYLSVNQDFKDYKQLCVAGVTTYFLINFLGDFIIRITGCSKYIFMGGSKEENFKISSFTDVENATYNLLIYKDAIEVPRKYVKKVNQLFYKDGAMIHEIFLEDLKNLFVEKED
ncbi:putative Spc25 microsomal signal peptidase [Hamiltosporidium magnivora]|uniref:Signal peptidase complex subunit 2 n=1 Tax=Hamiltosporidium magnivora TaxID=148818 RepID=A0A4Q9LE94_9MICR|nr:putative Spc25 microsomal signal peptidase [Hamiltosporidium magnivora]TBU07656.1 putative Spc25 microsomal signal peptidase [Hamiltosporidium magnivora]